MIPETLTEHRDPAVPTPKQELVFMNRAARAVSRMGPAGRRWLRQWMDSHYPDER